MRDKKQLRRRNRGVRRVFRKNLIRLRRTRGLSQEKLALASRVDRRHTGQVELGNASPTIDIVAKFARALSVEPAALLAKDFDRKGRRVFRITRRDLDLLIRALRVAERIRRSGG